jgi:hypothetical protein
MVRSLLLMVAFAAAAPVASQGIDFLDGDSFEDGCTTDTDSDRLPDCFETGNNIYASPMRTGTLPNNSDTDLDGLTDGDEVLGSSAGLNLPAMGAKPLRKTVLVEYDWFDDAVSCAAHSHRPSAAIISTTAAAFTAMPVNNPDGSTGIDFIQDYGQGGLFTGGNLIADADGDIAVGVNGAEFANYKAANFASSRFRYFHYVILPHTYVGGTSSGQAELPGDDLIVSLACVGSTTNVRNTVVHEIGHNFGLRHGGDVNCNYKPNYNSLMNYRYQFPGADTNCTVAGDGLTAYSPGVRPSLVESALNEQAGICGLAAAVPVDWNNNGTLENPVSVDINAGDTSQVANCGATLSTLGDFNDYGNLNLAHIRSTPDAPIEVMDCTNAPPF